MWEPCVRGLAIGWQLISCEAPGCHDNGTIPEQLQIRKLAHIPSIFWPVGGVLEVIQVLPLVACPISIPSSSSRGSDGWLHLSEFGGASYGDLVLQASYFERSRGIVDDLLN